MADKWRVVHDVIGQQARNGALLCDINAIQSCWRLWYKRRLTKAERLAYIWGRIDELTKGQHRG